VLWDRVSAREAITERAADRARSAAAARRGKLASRVVIPSRSGLVFHLGGKLSQDVGWQLFLSVRLGNIVTKLGWVVAIVDHGRVLIGNGRMMAGNNRAATGIVVRWYSVWMLASVKELGNGWVGLGSTRNLLRVSVGNTVLANWERWGVVGKLVAGRRGNRSGGLAGFDHVNSNSSGEFFRVFRGACMV
jgi:hypothetical protein